MVAEVSLGRSRLRAQLHWELFSFLRLINRLARKAIRLPRLIHLVIVTSLQLVLAGRDPAFGLEINPDHRILPDAFGATRRLTILNGLQSLCLIPGRTRLLMT